MKKTLTTILAGVMALGIAGCKKISPCERAYKTANRALNQYNNTLNAYGDDIKPLNPLTIEDFIPKNFFYKGRLYNYEKVCKFENIEKGADCKGLTEETHYTPKENNFTIEKCINQNYVSVEYICRKGDKEGLIELNHTSIQTEETARLSKSVFREKDGDYGCLAGRGSCEILVRRLKFFMEKLEFDDYKQKWLEERK